MRRNSYLDQRSTETVAKIRAAVLGRLNEGVSPLKITIEDIAAQSGVAKTTIYRRHSNSLALVAWVMFDEEFPQTSTLITDHACESIFDNGELNADRQIMKFGARNVLAVAVAVDEAIGRGEMDDALLNLEKKQAKQKRDETATTHE